MPSLRLIPSGLIGRRQLLQVAGLSIFSGLTSVDAAQVRPNSKRRVVCVGGGLTEIVCALGQESSLVGVDTTSRFPLSVRRLPSVGYARNLSLEGMLALAPQNVIVNHDAGPISVLSRLRDVGVAVSTAEDGYTVESLLLRVKQLGRILRCEERAQLFAEKLWRDWSAVAQDLPALQSDIRVMFVLGQSPGQFIVAGAGTGAHAMMQYAGLQNAFADTDGYRPITTEALIAAQPDLLVLTQPGAMAHQNASSASESIIQIQGLAMTPAARASRWLMFDTMFLLGFGPRMPDAILALRRASNEAMRV
jgi:iron complex transport system substrate-binding protein